MRENDFRRMALGMPGAIEGAHMGHPDFRVNNRIFATLHPGREFGMVNLTPDQQEQFTGAHPEAFAPESGAWGIWVRGNLGGATCAYDQRGGGPVEQPRLSDRMPSARRAKEGRVQFRARDRKRGETGTDLDRRRARVMGRCHAMLERYPYHRPGPSVDLSVGPRAGSPHRP